MSFRKQGEGVELIRERQGGPRACMDDREYPWAGAEEATAGAGGLPWHLGNGRAVRNPVFREMPNNCLIVPV